MYLTLVALGFFLVYSFLYYLFPLFFKKTLPTFRGMSFTSLAIIFGLCMISFFVSFNIKDINLGNRILHIFGGGFLAFFICFLVVKDTKIEITKFEFFVFSFLIAMSLGAGNEILEYFLQNYLGLSFAKTANDTWLDLMSNAVGALIAGAIFVPFVKNKSK